MLRKSILTALTFYLILCVSAYANCARAGWQADILTRFHQADGIITIVDEDTIQVDHFYYDGLGIDVYFYLGADESDEAFSNGLQIGPDFYGTVYEDASVTIDLPAGHSVYDYNSISLWCVSAGANFGSGTFQCSGSTAQYKLTYIGNWSPTNHPDSYPANDHLTGPVGGTHNCDVNIWTPQTVVSQGVQDIAERGIRTVLVNEVNAAISDGTAYSLISGVGLNPPYDNSVSRTFEMNSCYPLVSLVSMIAPSPDWFLGVGNLPLYENGQWRDKVTVDLYPWDAGTDSGVTFTSLNDVTVPRDISRRLTDAPFEQTTSLIIPMGQFVFERIDVCPHRLDGDINRDCVVDLADFAEFAKNWLVDCSVTPFNQACLNY